MKNQRNGIVAGGNWIVDHIKIIDQFPNQDGLANILEQHTNTGGAPYNILKNLARLGAPFRLSGVGLVGDDEDGNYILDDCIKNGIDKKSIKTVKGKSTSFTDVLTVKSTGRRTFLHQQGVNGLLDSSHFRLEKFKRKIFHMGYLLLLDGMDTLGKDGRTEASHLFEKAQEMGFKTSADLVSENNGRYKTHITNTLPYVNYLFLNTFELEQLTGSSITKGEVTNLDAVRKAAGKVMDMGVKDWLVVDYKNGILAMDASKKFYIQGKVKVPKELVVSEVGAGDAIAAGILWGLHEDWPIEKAMRLAVSAAACCLLDVSCCDGILPLEETLEKADSWGFNTVG